MRQLSKLMVIVACLALIPLVANAASSWSVGRYISGSKIKSKPFDVGQCTWYVDGKTDRNGWDILFKQGSGRDAYKWYKDSLLKNANRGNLGYPGDIMVFDKGIYSGDQAGHVAYVTSSGKWNGKRAWTVRHANWTSDLGQTHVETVDNKKIKQCTFVEVGANPTKVSVVYRDRSNKEVLGSSRYTILGFMYKK